MVETAENRALISEFSERNGLFSDKEENTGLVDGNNSAKDSVNAWLNLDEPLITQLFRMDINKEDYMRLVHIPRYRKDPVRIFENPIMERLTYSSWQTMLLFWLSIISILLFNVKEYFEWNEILKFSILGFCLWSGVEYAMHRFIFHAEAWVPDHKNAFIIHFLTHAIHHMLPMEKYRLIMPLGLSVPLGVFLWISFSPFFSLHTEMCLFIGGILGYISYDLTHYYLHHGTCNNVYSKFLKSYHLRHHYDNHNIGFGVSSPIWDYIFGTEILLPCKTG